MDIYHIHFSKDETAALYALAGATLMEQGIAREEVIAVAEQLSPANVLRLALGFAQRKRGGARENTGPKVHNKTGKKTA